MRRQIAHVNLHELSIYQFITVVIRQGEKLVHCVSGLGCYAAHVPISPTDVRVCVSFRSRPIFHTFATEIRLRRTRRPRFSIMYYYAFAWIDAIVLSIGTAILP